MTTFVRTLEALRAAVANEAAGAPADLETVPDRGAVAALQVTRDAAGRASLVVVTPPRPAALAGLTAAFGAAGSLPRRPSGGTRTVLFRDTLPADGQSGITVLAELDGRGHAARVLLRRDEL